MASPLFPTGDPFFDDLRRRSEESQKPKPVAKGPTPKPQEWYSNLGEAAVQTLAQAVHQFLPQGDVGLKAFNQVEYPNAIARTIGEGPVGAILRTNDAARQQLAQVEQAMTQRIMAQGGNPEPSMNVKGNVPVRAPLEMGLRSVNPMLGALAQGAPDTAPVDATITRGDAARFTGDVGRQAVEWEAGAGALKSVQTFQKFSAAQKLLGAQKFNVAKVLEDTVAGFTTGALDTFIQERANADGTYNPAETLKHAAETAVGFGLGGAVFQSLGQVAKTIKADIMSKALSKADNAAVAAGKARKPTINPAGLDVASKELGVDSLSGLRIEAPAPLKSRAFDPLNENSFQQYRLRYTKPTIEEKLAAAGAEDINFFPKEGATKHEYDLHIYEDPALQGKLPGSKHFGSGGEGLDDVEGLLSRHQQARDLYDHWGAENELDFERMQELGVEQQTFREYLLHRASEPQLVKELLSYSPYYAHTRGTFKISPEGKRLGWRLNEIQSDAFQKPKSVLKQHSPEAVSEERIWLKRVVAQEIKNAQEAGLGYVDFPVSKTAASIPGMEGDPTKLPFLRYDTELPKVIQGLGHRPVFVQEGPHVFRRVVLKRRPAVVEGQGVTLGSGLGGAQREIDKATRRAIEMQERRGRNKINPETVKSAEPPIDPDTGRPIAAHGTVSRGQATPPSDTKVYRRGGKNEIVDARSSTPITRAGEDNPGYHEGDATRLGLTLNEKTGKYEHVAIPEDPHYASMSPQEQAAYNKRIAKPVDPTKEFSQQSFMSAQRLNPTERQVMIESLGEAKGTRFGRSVKDLSDSELIVVARDARAAATRKAATEGTSRARKLNPPTEDVVAKRRADNIKMIQNAHKSLSIEDVAALSKTSVERVAGADPKKLAAWLRTNSDALKAQGVKNFNANRSLKPRNYATGAEHKAVADVLKKHGFLPDEVALALNAGFEPPASGIPSLDPIDVAKAVKPGDVYRFDATALDKDLASGTVGRKLRYLRAVAADMKTLPPEVQALYPATPEGAVKFLNSQRQGKFPGVSAESAEEMMQRKFHGDKVSFDEYVEGQDPFEATHAEAPTQVGDATVAPDKVYTVKYQGADGQEAIANMYGDEIIESNAAGNLEKPTIKEVPSADPEHDDVIDTFLGSGFGAAQPLYEKYVEKRLAKYGPEFAAQWRDFKNKSTPEGLLRFMVAFELPTSVAHREPSFWKAVDTAANAEAIVAVAEKRFSDLTRKNQDMVRLVTRHPKEAQALADKLIEWNWQYKMTKRSVEQAKRDADIAGIMQSLDPRGQKMLQTVYDQISAIRSSAQQELTGGLKEAANFSKRPVEMQKRFVDVIDRKINANPDYVHFNRKGSYSVSVAERKDIAHSKDSGWTTVHKESWESLSDAKKGLADLKRQFGDKATYTFEDRVSNTRSVNDKPEKFFKSSSTTQDEDNILEMLDLDQIMPEAIPTDMESKLQALAEETVIGKTSTYLGKRQYIPGFKTDLQTIYDDFERLHVVGSKLKAASMVRNKKSEVMSYIQNGLITKNPKKQRILMDYADKYLGLAEKPITEKTGFGLLRSGLAHLQLAMKAQFPVVNLTQTMVMSANMAAGYGPRGMARWAAAHKLATTYALQHLRPKSQTMSEFAAHKLPGEIVKGLTRLSDEGQLGTAIVDELASLTHQQAGGIDKTLTKYMGAGASQGVLKTVSGASKAATMGIAITERYNRLVDALTFLGIGHDLGHRGDDLFNFARRNIAQAELRYSDMWLPQAATSNKSVGESVKLLKMFWRFPVAQYVEMKNALRDSVRSVSHEDARGLLKAMPSKRSGPRVIRNQRDVVGKSRLRAPIAALGQLAVGGSMAFDPTVLGSIGVASAVGVGGAMAAETAMKAYNQWMPSTDKMLSDLKGPSADEPSTNLSWDERTRHWESKLNIPDNYKGVVHYGAPALAGVNIGRSTSVSTPLQVLSSPVYPNGVINDLLKSISTWKRTGDGTQLLRIASIGKGVNEASEMARTGRVTVSRGDEKTALEDQNGEPYTPELLDYVASVARFETVKVADLRNKTANAQALTRRREQLQNTVKKDIKSYIEKSGEDTDWADVQEKLAPVMAWNDLAMSKGLAQRDPALLIDTKSMMQKFTEQYEEVLFAEGAPRTPTQRVQLAQSRGRRPSTKDILTSDEGDE